MKRMVESARRIRSLSDAVGFFWDYMMPFVASGLAGVVFYWTLDRVPARSFAIDPERGTGGFITPAGSQEPGPVTAGMIGTVHWFVKWQRNCDKVELFQEITINTNTSARQVIRLEKIPVRSRANVSSSIAPPPPEWITRDFFIPASANLCTREHCAPVEAEYRSTLTDYCNPVHKFALPMEMESPIVKFTIAPSVASPPNGEHK
jgi:hypothetical protein